MPLIWAIDAGGSFIRAVPNPSQIAIQAGAASFTDGFPPVCFTPVGSGGTPPFGQDFNGIYNQCTAWLQWFQAGVVFQPYDASFSNSGTYNIGGYPKGAILASASTFGQFWMSTADNNTSDPDTGGANWVSVSFGAFGNRIITASTAQTLTVTDNVVGFNRASPAAQNVTLPTYSGAGRVTIQDLNKNFSAGIVTVLPPGGTGTISGDSSYQMAEDKQTATFTFYPASAGGPLWGVDS